MANNEEKYEKFIAWEWNIKSYKKVTTINDPKMEMGKDNGGF